LGKVTFGFCNGKIITNGNKLSMHLELKNKPMEKKSRFSIKVSESFEETVILKALELVKEGKTEGEVDSKHFGHLGIFIDHKPELVMLSYQGTENSPELHGKTIYIGGNHSEKDNRKSS
jgi:hypothetical protein